MDDINKHRCGFDIKVEDKVIDINGNVGGIYSICTCELCIGRRWHEPIIKYKDGSHEWITPYVVDVGFRRYYQIGDKLFPEHLDKKDLTQQWMNLFAEKAKLDAKETRLLKMLDIARESEAE